MKPTSKTVGVLGGMGPYATFAFCQTLLSETPASKDWEHLRVVIDNNPHIPSRTRHFLYGEESPFNAMLESCRKLQDYPVDFIALPCNSAAIFVPELQGHLRVPILNICEIAANALASAHPQRRRAAAIGSYVTYKQQTYKPFLASRGIELIDHGQKIQEISEDLIESLKLGRSDAGHVEALQELVRRLSRDFDAEAVVLACTEFGCLPQFDADIPLVDSSLQLAKHVVSLARS